MDIESLQRSVLDWADQISPGRSPKDAVVKLVSETSELLDAVLNGGDVEGELGDCVILLLDLCKMYNINLVKAGHKKMRINVKRKWYSDDGVIRRVKPNGKSDNGHIRKAKTDAGQTVPDLPRKPGAKRGRTQLQRTTNSNGTGGRSPR